MSENLNYINIIFLSNEWDGYHRKAFVEEMVKKLNSWSVIILLQLPISLFVHIFTNFRKKIIGLTKRKFKTVEIYKNTYLFTPIIFFHYLLWNKSILFFKFDYLLLNYQLNRFIKKNIGTKKNVVWYYFPYFKYLAIKCSDAIKIYDQYDIYHMNVNGNIDKKLKSINDDLIKISDLVLNTTKNLYDISKKINTNSYYITNGNNFDLLSKTNQIPAKITLPIQDAKIIGYLGGIRDWIDFDLLEYIISSKNACNFLFIGSIYPSAYKNMQKILSYKNVLWLDYIQPENLPSYLSLFDVGLIPFKTTEFFKCVFPNKFFEYLASGIPVITTSLQELKKYEKLIGYSNDYNDFLENCERALTGYYNKYTHEYKKIAEDNSWKEKAKVINNIIEELFLNK